MRTATLQLAFMIYLACITSFIASATSGQGSVTDEQYHQDMRRVSHLGRQAAKTEIDPNTLRSAAADIENRWKDTNRDEYGRLILRLMAPVV